MIVPFMFTLDEYSDEKPTAMWLMYKYLYFCYQNKMPIISMEYYFDNIITAQEKRHSSTLDIVLNRYNYKILDKKSYDKIIKSLITYKDVENIIKFYGNNDKAWESILKEKNKFIETIIESKIDEIEKKCNKKIDCLITWVWFPSLEKVAKKRNIKLLNLEISTIRKGLYREQLGYFCFENKYDSSTIEDKYQEFLKIKNKTILSRKEILSLFLEDEAIDFVNKLYIQPKYDIGIALGLKKDFFESTYSNYTYQDLIEFSKKIVPSNKISVRKHPAMPLNLSESGFVIDDSNSSAEWISKCKNIVCTISNIGYEAMLYNRGLISVSKNIATSFNETSSLEFIEEDVVGISKINFLTFYYYVPFDLMFDYNYIMWRLKNPSIEEIYNKNFNYLFLKYNIDINDFMELGVNRIDLILNTHDITKKKKESIKKFGYDYMDNQYLLLQQKYDYLESEHIEAVKINENNNNEIIKLNNYIHNLENSLSWRVTKPIRKFSSIIRKK